ncbi:DUF2878 domain-containing protein, partial [Pseudomonas syringae pv. tagetis]
IGLFACVLGGYSYWLLIDDPLLAVQFLWMSSWAEEGGLILTVTLNGIVLDSGLMTIGDFDLCSHGYLLHLCLAVLRAVERTTLNH